MKWPQEVRHENQIARAGSDGTLGVCVERVRGRRFEPRKAGKIVIELGSDGERVYFRPNHLVFETGKAYNLVLKNTDKTKHELEAHEFVEKIFTRKVEVVDREGQMLAEIKGSVSEVEVGPGGEVEWLFVPMQTGKDLSMDCALPGHKEAGMFGTITIN